MFKKNLIYCACAVGLLALIGNFYVSAKSYLLYKENLKVPEMEMHTLRNQVARLLTVYDVSDENGILEAVRHGKDNDGGYVAPVKAFKSSDVLLGYGIDIDNSFEDLFSEIYNKPSYGFDCGIDGIGSKSKLFTFVKECIASDNFLYAKKSKLSSLFFAYKNYNVSTFSQQIEKLNLKDKKYFIKMDIEGAEYEAFEDILQHHAKNITGIVLEIHFLSNERNSLMEVVKLLTRLRAHFTLMHVHGNNYAQLNGFVADNANGIIPYVIELSFINNNLITHSKISSNQSHPTKLDMPNWKDKLDMHFEILGTVD